MKSLTLFATLASFIVFCSFTILQEANADLVSIQETEYEEGWKDGHCEGWHDVKPNSYCPHAGYAPAPEIGKDTYKHGYNRGFKQGLKDARK